MSGYPQHYADGQKYGIPHGGQHGHPHGGQFDRAGPTVVTTQPNVMVVSPNSPAPKSYMALAVCSCLCCVWPIGLAAIIFSSKSADAARAGDMEDAESKGRVSLGLSIASIVLGLILVIVIVALFATGNLRYSTYYGK